MPMDAICMQAVVRETAAQIENARIEKIQQPARDQVILLLRGGRRLLLNAGASQPRLHLTQQLRDNPAQPPMFCMLLRKHLAGGRTCFCSNFLAYHAGHSRWNNTLLPPASFQVHPR